MRKCLAVILKSHPLQARSALACLKDEGIMQRNDKNALFPMAMARHLMYVPMLPVR